ncbi:MAG: MoaD/ThiS family protein [Methanotrichaceae archaeon]
MKITLHDGIIKEMPIQRMVIEEILKLLGINPVEVVVAKNGKIVSELEMAQSEDELRIVRIVHGG